MPLDANIPLQVKQFQLESPVAQFGNALQLQAGMNQNALAQLQMQKARRDFADEDADRQAIMSAGGDLEGARNALLQRGRIKPAMEISKQLLEQRKTQAGILRDEAETNLKHLGVLSSVLSPLATKPDVSLDDVAGLLTTAQAAGVPESVVKNIANAVPKNAMALPGFVRNLAMTTENGRKALEMALPKLEWRGTGQQDIPVQMNPLAPGYGQQASGVAPIQKVMTPGEVDTAARTREQMVETGRHNRASEGLTALGMKLTDARAREANANTQNNQQVNTEGKIRDDFVKASTDFTKVRDAHQRVLESAKDPSAAGDLALIFNYMKVLDPGSTVREGEFATAQNSGGIPDRVRAQYNKAINGERLAPAIRTDFVDRSQKLYTGAVKNQEKLEADYTEISKRSGARPENVVIKNRTEGEAPSRPPKISGDSDYAKLPSGSEFIDPDGIRRRKP